MGRSETYQRSSNELPYKYSRASVQILQTPPPNSQSSERSLAYYGSYCSLNCLDRLGLRPPFPVDHKCLPYRLSLPYHHTSSRNRLIRPRTSSCPFRQTSSMEMNSCHNLCHIHQHHCKVKCHIWMWSCRESNLRRSG